jgi:type 1 glutamine amidotransferase
MKNSPVPILALAAALLACSAGLCVTGKAAEPDKIRVLLVHGGHDFETNQFFAMFRANREIAFTVVQHPAAQAWFNAERAKEYDVLVFYDMWQEISDEAKAGLMAVLESGKGLVALHHCLASFPKWDEYSRIIGGKYHASKWKRGDAEMPASTYKHDVHIDVRIADPGHPVTRGLKDFVILDEIYGGFEVKPESHVLLTTDTAGSGREIAWSKTYRGARVVYLQLGHDHHAYENPNYRQLVSQAITWVARRDGL